MMSSRQRQAQLEIRALRAPHRIAPLRPCSGGIRLTGVALRGPSDPAETPAKPSLKGQLLIATPAMRDPRFEHAVILMMRHGQDGAMGIVIKRPLGEQPLGIF